MIEPTEIARLPELRSSIEQCLCAARSHSSCHIGNIELADRLLDVVIDWLNKSPTRAKIEAAAVEQMMEDYQTTTGDFDYYGFSCLPGFAEGWAARRRAGGAE